ncbi:MAG: Isoleucyl-tRNA synthetase [uncultured Chloroflexi bacterium]|uniref:Isoleucine--tRNA ligase n=1 Tax=uncultured Chloroflexota bacterium TaxID=166587 RepID=A0A6J4KGE8_9CHLR|nr:MAG: Isoleucyl-tRNA synthetase [uncultured Chloroflexota bacterium]
MAFQEVDPKVSFPRLEQDVREWWVAQSIVKKALAHGDRERPFVFFEGPPTANGRPGVHHIESRASKDIILRYRRMRGQYVIGARGGWDTHGLPVELEVEKELGFSGKPDIERYGIAAFNEACRKSVWRYTDEWERMTDRVAFWVDLEDAYVTYHNSYIESLWWILKTLWDKDLLFRDYKVTMHCPRCGTSLSDHEVSLGFEDDVDDPSVWLRFNVRPSGHALDEQLDGAAFIAWTTTPWTLPANVALAVNPSAAYVLVQRTAEGTGATATGHDGQHETERLLLAEALAPVVLGEHGHEVLGHFQGSDLVGLRYERLFDGVPAQGQQVDLDQAYRVIADDFVSLEDGTGIVHIAPAYGDLEVGRKYGLPTLFSVDLAGKTLPEFESLGFAGLFFKDADPLITRNLRERGLLFRSGRVKHSYPFCWRCKTPLLYYAKPSWYIRTTARKDALLANNEQVQWVPQHIQHGRFGNWLENNVDWALSRERYWGTPLPIWVCDACGDTTVAGSVKEMSDRAGRDLSELDLHRPYVDDITWSCTKEGCSGTQRRIPDVADCWFDSGAMPIAQWHYPFEHQDIFQAAGKAEFISEAIDQTRGWFYTLHALSTLLFDRPAFSNVICLGHILDTKGQKMSKSRGNVVEPADLLETYGADATRWYMYASNPPYQPRRFSPDHVGEVLRQFMLTLWNTYSFFITYANLDRWQPPAGSDPLAGVELQPIDRWVLARLNALTRDVTSMLDGYDIHGPAKEIEKFVDELSNWYVRRNRRRFWKSEVDADKQAAFATLYTCLTTVARLVAPFMPYLSEAIYRNLVASQDSSAAESVHVAAWPEVNQSLVDDELLAATALLLETVSLGRSARRTAGQRIRQPLAEVVVSAPRDPKGAERLRRFEDELRDELNVKQVRFLDVGGGLVVQRLKANLPVVGRRYGKQVPALRQALEALVGPEANAAAGEVRAARPFELLVDGATIQVQPDEVLVEASSPPGYTVAESDGLLVALNTEISAALRLEGQARDLVRYVQDARKAANLAITDRIDVTLQPSAGLELESLLRAHGEYVKAETLSNSISVGHPAAGAHTAGAELDGGSVVVGFSRSREAVHA